jgi:uncharacterized protein
MTAMHPANSLDLTLLLLVTIVWPVVEWRWYYPLSVAAIAAGDPRARLRLYVQNILPQWLFTACLIALWRHYGRSWTPLRFTASSPARLAAGLAVAAVGLGLLWQQRRGILAKTERLTRVRKQVIKVAPLIPHTLPERRVAILLAFTAGICEELLFRGFVLWYFVAIFPPGWMWLALGAIISSALFGFGHIYQGAKAVPMTAAVGLIFALIVLAAGSLWPAMILHAAIDWNSFDLGYRAMATEKQHPA